MFTAQHHQIYKLNYLPKTVSPSLLKTSTNPAAVKAATNVPNDPLPTATSTIVPKSQLGSSVVVGGASVVSGGGITAGQKSGDAGVSSPCMIMKSGKEKCVHQ